MGKTLSKREKTSDPTDDFWNQFMSKKGPDEQRLILRRLNYYHNLIYLEQDYARLLSYIETPYSRNILVISANKFMSLSTLLDNERIQHVRYKRAMSLSDISDFFTGRKLLLVEFYDTLSAEEKHDVNNLLRKNLTNRNKIVVCTNDESVNIHDLSQQIFILNYFDETSVLR